MLTKEEKEKYDIDYQKKNMKHFSFWLNKKKDAELIDWLEQKGNPTVSKHIKTVLRKVMNDEKHIT